MAKRGSKSGAKSRTRRAAKPLHRLIGERVRALRDERGMPRTELARRSGASLTSLNLLEGAQVQPSLQTLEAVAKALEVRVADLLDEEPVPAKKPAEGTMVFARIMDRLRDRDPAYLRQVEKLLKAFDGAVESARD